MDLETILNEVKNVDLQLYKDIITYCESRIPETEGFPAIIGLDDLTDPSRPIYEGAGMDAQMNEKMALDALIFTWLYSQITERDLHYPAIAPAMSALAEKSFLIKEGETEASQYRTLWQEKK